MDAEVTKHIQRSITSQFFCSRQNCVWNGSWVQTLLSPRPNKAWKTRMHDRLNWTQSFGRFAQDHCLLVISDSIHTASQSIRKYSSQVTPEHRLEAGSVFGGERRTNIWVRFQFGGPTWCFQFLFKLNLQSHLTIPIIVAKSWRNSCDEKFKRNFTSIINIWRDFMLAKEETNIP